MQSINLLLVGREGNGKSSVGNSILRKKVFNPRTSFSPQVAETPILGTAIIEGRTVNVVDGVRADNGGETFETMVRHSETAMELVSGGYTAFLVVLQYGIRFTQQEKTALDKIRYLFGDNIFREYGIIVMTRGDQFKYDAEEEGLTFGDWCERQSGFFGELWRECGGRCVLFNNRTTKDEQDEQDEQVKQLLQKISALPQGCSSTQLTVSKQPPATLSGPTS